MAPHSPASPSDGYNDRRAIRRHNNADDDDANDDDTNGSHPKTGSARYSWNNDVVCTRALIRLVSETVQAKPEHKRRVSASEWEVVLDAFNREVNRPADCVRVLHNRMANLRAQCKDYHQVLKAQRAGLLESVDDWLAFIKANPAQRKWRKKPFVFYEEMAACLRLQGEDLDDEHQPRPLGDDANDEQLHANGDYDDANGEPRKRKKSGRPPHSVTAAEASPLVALSRQRHEQLQALATSTGRNVRRRSADALAASSASTAAAGGPVVSISHYPAALRHLAKLNLPIADRVDAKRFLVADANSQAFIYMDDDERRFYLQKYCFDRRDELQSAASAPPASTAAAGATTEQDEQS